MKSFSHIKTVIKTLYNLWGGLEFFYRRRNVFVLSGKMRPGWRALLRVTLAIVLLFNLIALPYAESRTRAREEINETTHHLRKASLFMTPQRAMTMAEELAGERDEKKSKGVLFPPFKSAQVSGLKVRKLEIQRKGLSRERKGALERTNQWFWYGKVAGIAGAIHLFGSLAALATNNAGGGVILGLTLGNGAASLGSMVEVTIFFLKGVGTILVLWMGVHFLKRILPVLTFIIKDLKNYGSKKIEKWMAQSSASKEKSRVKSFYELTPSERREVLDKSIYGMPLNPEVEIPAVYTLHGPSDRAKLADLMKMLWRNQTEHDINSYEEIDAVVRFGLKRDDLIDKIVEKGQKPVDIQVRYDQDLAKGRDSLTPLLAKYMEIYLERYAMEETEIKEKKGIIKEFVLIFEKERDKNYRYLQRKNIRIVAYEGNGMAWFEDQNADIELVRLDSYLMGFMLDYGREAVLAIDKELLERLAGMKRRERENLERLIAIVLLMKMTIMGAASSLDKELREGFLGQEEESLEELQSRWMAEGKLATWEMIKKITYDWRNKLWKKVRGHQVLDDKERDQRDAREKRVLEKRMFSFDQAHQALFFPLSSSWEILSAALRRFIRDYWKVDKILRKFPWPLMEKLEIALEQTARAKITDQGAGSEPLADTARSSFKRKMARAQADILLWFGRETLETFMSLSGKLIQGGQRGQELLEIIHEFRNVPGIKGMIEDLNQNPEDKRAIAKLYRAYELKERGYETIALDFKCFNFTADLAALREVNSIKKFYFFEVKSNPENRFSMQGNVGLARWLERMNEHNLREEALPQFADFRSQAMELFIGAQIRVGGAISTNGMIVLKALSNEPFLRENGVEIDEEHDLTEEEDLASEYFRLTPGQLEEMRTMFIELSKLSLEEMDEVYDQSVEALVGIKDSYLAVNNNDGYVREVVRLTDTHISRIGKNNFFRDFQRGKEDKVDLLVFLATMDYLVRKGIIQAPSLNSVERESQLKDQGQGEGHGTITGVIVAGLIGLGAILSSAGVGWTLDFNSFREGLAQWNGVMEFLTMAGSAFVLSSFYVNLKKFMEMQLIGNQGFTYVRDGENRRVKKDKAIVELVAKNLGESKMVRELVSPLLTDILARNVKATPTKIMVNFVDLPSLIKTVKRYMEEKGEGKNIQLVVVIDEVWMSRKELRAELGKAGIYFKQNQIKIMSEKLEDGKFNLDRIFKKHRKYFTGSSVILLDGVGMWSLEEDIGDILRIVFSVEGSELADWVKRNMQGVSQENVRQIEKSRLFEKYSAALEQSQKDVWVLEVQQ